MRGKISEDYQYCSVFYYALQFCTIIRTVPIPTCEPVLNCQYKTAADWLENCWLRNDWCVEWDVRPNL